MNYEPEICKYALFMYPDRPYDFHYWCSYVGRPCFNPRKDVCANYFTECMKQEEMNNDV